MTNTTYVEALSARHDATSPMVIDLAALSEPVSSALRRLRLDGATGCHVILDARSVLRLPPGALAALVRLRRRVRARGGAVVVVAGDVAWTALRRSGLHHSLLCVGSMDEAVHVLANDRRHVTPGR